MGNKSFFASVEKLWNTWELSTIMLMSLFLQIFLVLFANQRKHTVKDWQRMLIWLAYLSADWVAITALGVLARSETDPTSPFSIPAFWAPILLMHLGGPDSITAYSAQDNDLWLRHLLVLVIDIGLAFYVMVKFWSNYTNAFVAIPIFIAGIIKYGERNWTLGSACFKIFRGDGSQALIQAGELITRHSANNPEAKFFREVYSLFQASKLIIKDIPLGVSTHPTILQKEALEAFELIEVGLSFLYDVLYTKRRSINVQLITLRVLSFLCSLSALLAFTLTVTRHPYSKIDAVVSYILLGGAVFLEIYSAIMFAFSDWTMVWLSWQKKPLANSIFQVLHSSRLRSFLSDKRWSSSMAQYDLIIARFGAPPYPWKKWLGLDGDIQRWEAVGVDLKKLIFNEILNKTSGWVPISTYDFIFLSPFFTERGDGVLRRKDCLADFGWSVLDVEFSHSLLTWHLATNLCYYDEFRRSGHNASRLCSNCRMSKSLSDYMMYLLVNYPFLLPGGTAETRYRQTELDVKGFYTQARATKSNPINWDHVCSLAGTAGAASDGTLIWSALSDGQRLVSSLQSLDGKGGWSNEKKWEMTSQVWVEMLIYVAMRCGWKEHAEKLAQGGELLTHVALLVRGGGGFTEEHGELLLG